MRTPEMEARHHASAVVAQLVLIICRGMLRGYSGRGKNIAAVFPDLLTVMAIRVNDDRRMRPTTPTKIAKATGLPRETVRRALLHLCKHGVIVKIGASGYIGNDAYMQARKDADYYRHIVNAIIAAARELSKLKKK